MWFMFFDNLRSSGVYYLLYFSMLVSLIVLILLPAGVESPDLTKAEHKSSRAIKGAPLGSLFAQFCLHSLWFGNCNIRGMYEQKCCGCCHSVSCEVNCWSHMGHITEIFFRNIFYSCLFTWFGYYLCVNSYCISLDWVCSRSSLVLGRVAAIASYGS